MLPPSPLHRSGRADFPHPVPRARVSLTMFAHRHSLLGQTFRVSSVPPAKSRSRPARRACQGWSRLRGHPLGLGLDWPEHGGILHRSGSQGLSHAHVSFLAIRKQFQYLRFNYIKYQTPVFFSLLARANEVSFFDRPYESRTREGRSADVCWHGTCFWKIRLDGKSALTSPLTSLDFKSQFGEIDHVRR
jgi:hypothetical protein